MTAVSETALVHHPDETLTSTALVLSTDSNTAEREAAAFELRHTFCAQLKASRERRGISLQTIAESTKISESLFADLERCDLSRWPTGIYRRAFFREYTAFVGLPASRCSANSSVSSRRISSRSHPNCAYRDRFD